MGSTIGQIVPLAIGVGINPIPIIAIILILLTPTARANGLLFVTGWIGGLLAVGGIAIVIANGTDLYGSGTQSSAARWIRAIVGVIVLGLAVKKWLGRPRADEDPATPPWMAALSSFTPLKSLGLGAGLAGGNPKNIALTVAAAAAIVESGMSGRSEAAALLVFTAIATAGVATPLIVLLTMGERARSILEGWSAWLARHNAIVVSVILLVIGVVLLSSALKP